MPYANNFDKNQAFDPEYYYQWAAKLTDRRLLTFHRSFAPKFAAAKLKGQFYYHDSLHTHRKFFATCAELVIRNLSLLDNVPIAKCDRSALVVRLRARVKDKTI